MTSRPLDLRADVHAHVADYVMDVDRLYFDAHPGEPVYVRPPLEHEWCCWRCATEGRCRPAVGTVVAVHVTNLGPGVRARRPIVGARHRCEHVLDLPALPLAWVERIDGAGS